MAYPLPVFVFVFVVMLIKIVDLFFFAGVMAIDVLR